MLGMLVLKTFGFTHQVLIRMLLTRFPFCKSGIVVSKEILPAVDTVSTQSVGLKFCQLLSSCRQMR